MEYNKEQMALIIGCFLGDGHLTKYKNKHNNTQLSIQHSGDQLSYLEWKRDLFTRNGFTVSKIYDVSRKFPAYRFNVTLGESGNILRHQLYPNNNRTITRHHLNYLNDLSLAIWFMDDGCRKVSWDKVKNKCTGRALHLSTQAFNYEEHLIMQTYFKKVWGVETKIYKDREHFRLSINATNAKIFIPIIRPYIHESLLYKIDLKYKNNDPRDIRDNINDDGIVYSRQKYRETEGIKDRF